METMPLEQFKTLYKMAVALGERNGVDVICITEPPEVNMNSGELVQNKYPEYKKAIEDVAMEEGATLINLYEDLLKKKQAGENIAKLSSNGILPNIEGYKYISELITEGIVSSNGEFKKVEEKASVKLVTQYSTKKDLPKIKPQNLSTKGTSKKFNTGNEEALVLDAGQSSAIQVPSGEIVGAVVTFINSNNGKTAQVKVSAGETNNTVKISGNQVKEMSSYIALQNAKDLKEIVLSSNGTVYLSGVTFVIKD